MEDRKFTIIINPLAGTDDKSIALAYIEKKLTEKRLIYFIPEAELSGNYDFLTAHIAEKKITDIIICGGDGTVNIVASQIAGTKIRIGIIPMGSGNGLAFAAGIPKDYKKALKIILAGRAEYTDAFLINNHFSCMLCGLGFDAKVAHAFAAQHTRGLGTYILETLKHFFTAETYPFQIKANGVTIDAEAFFISIANSNQFGNNFTIAPEARLSDGKIDVVIVNKTGKFNLIFKILRQVRRGKIVHITDRRNTVHYFQTTKMTIANLGNAPLHIDGDACETAPFFEINILPEAFLLLHPPTPSYDKVKPQVATVSS